MTGLDFDDSQYIYIEDVKLEMYFHCFTCCNTLNSMLKSHNSVAAFLFLWVTWIFSRYEEHTKSVGNKNIKFWEKL